MKNTAEREGVIKYDLVFSPRPPLPLETLATLNAWRTILYRLHLIGQSPQRYDGFGYGNISQRLEHTGTVGSMHSFVISGTQTGATETLQPSQFCLVTQAHPKQNRILAEGPIRPSSEALTHASIYQSSSQIEFVMHVHCPEIWHNTETLNIPRVDKTVAYGTPEMAVEVERLVQTHSTKDKGVFSMLGHEDGIVSYGHTARLAGNALINTLISAFQLTGKRCN